MNQKYLTTLSIVSINHVDFDSKFYLTSKSFISTLFSIEGDDIFLTCEMSERDFENSLFYVEVDGNNREFKSFIEFGQKVVLRHKISNKYLSHSDDFEEVQNDTTYRLKLSHHRHYFKILPCFQYQTKISNKIRFNEDMHLVTDINQVKTVYLSAQKTNQQHIRSAILGMNYYSSIGTSRFSFHSYYECEKDESYYTFGSIIWLSHIESSTFISTKPINNKKQIIFEAIEYEKDLQSINGLWLIESQNFGVGGRLSFQQKFRMKNLSEGTYLSFSKNYKMNQNQRVYNIQLESVPSNQSQFIFRSLIGENATIKKGSYLIFRHEESKIYIGCRKNLFFPDTEIRKPISYSEFSDEDLYKIIELNENEEEAIRFILSIRQELEGILADLKEDPTLQIFLEEKEIYKNIEKELNKLKGFEKLFQKVQGEIGSYIEYFCQLLNNYRLRLKKDPHSFSVIEEIMKLIYSILGTICCENRRNQQISYQHLHDYVDDIFLGIGEISTLIQTFKNNHMILCKAPKPLPKLGNRNIVRATLDAVLKFSNDKNQRYFEKLTKIIEFLRTLVLFGNSSIDINQTIISEQFFGPDKKFAKIFFDIKVINNRIKVEEEHLHYVDLDKIKNPQILIILEEVFKLFSLLCSHRNFISKKLINQYLNTESSNFIEVLIAYLKMPISINLSNSLYSLITNLYIDSSPRIEREKPLAVINFAIKVEEKSVMEEIEMSGRLKNALASRIEEYSSRALQISNLMQFCLKVSMEPTLTSDELALFKQEVSRRISGSNISPQLLRSVKILLRLESYTSAQIIEIVNKLKAKLKSNNKSHTVVIEIMQIFLEVTTYRQQIELRKLTAYLKYKYRMKQHQINYGQEYEYLLPFSKRLIPSIQYPDDVNDTIASYNDQSDLLLNLRMDSQMINVLLSLLTSPEGQKNSTYLERLFQYFLLENFQKLEFMKVLLNSIVITSEEVAIFDSLFEIYKKLKHLTSISEYWLCNSDSHDDNFKNYIEELVEVIRYFHQDYEGGGGSTKLLKDYSRTVVREDKIYVNRQLLIRNIGFHKLVLEILEGNYYLLDTDNTKSEQYIKAQQIFSLNFQFIFGFIYDCNETKDIIHKSWSILNKFQSLPETGQTYVFRELYKNRLEYIREIKKSFIERIIIKIVKNPKSKSNEGCEFNPEYLRYLESIIKVNETIYQPNLEALYRLIEKESIFKKMFYGEEQEDGKIKLCLSMFQIKTEEYLQIPYIYHVKFLGIISDMINNLVSQSVTIKVKLQSIFNFNYLLSLLREMDIYTHNGLEPQLKFLLKREIMKIVTALIDKHDSINFLQDNDELLSLVNFYYSTFVQRQKKINIEALNAALYLPYYSEYKATIEFYQNNERLYYCEQIVPFLQKIQNIFTKSKKQINNAVCKRIREIFEEVDLQKLTKFQYNRKVKHNNIDKVSFKWLNYVDKDENNSPQEKFAKFSIIELLRNPVVENVLQNQTSSFFKKVIENKKIEFVDVLIRLLRMNIEKEYNESESQQNYSQIQSILRTFTTFTLALEGKEFKSEFALFLMEQNLIKVLISYCIKIDFDFSKTIIRNIFHEILKALIFIIENNEEQKSLKEMYKIFSENPLSFRFWKHLNQSILTISANLNFDKAHEEVNWALSKIYLLGQKKQENIYENALKFLQKLCLYYPFTQLLRYQPLYPSIDFLQIIYHTLHYTLTYENKLKINALIAEATENILRVISGMMFGGNQTNQNYIIDNKFPQIITQVLKLERIKQKDEKSSKASRDGLVDEVIRFYSRNGIDLSQGIRSKIQILDFNHPYVLNRLKYSMLKTLADCISGNELAQSKIKFQISIELLKVNLIWIYEDYVAGKYVFLQKVVLRRLQKWEKAVENQNLDGLFLRTGFYIYILIENNDEGEEENNEEEEGIIDDQEKNKQKIMKKFFSTISEKDRKNQKIKKIEKEKYAEEMKIYYEKYYAALEFFSKKTITIEVNFVGRLTKVYFPRIPLCDNMTDRMIDEFKQDANRISQQEKIKSLFEFEEESYDILQGQQDFFCKFSKAPVFQAFLRLLIEDKLRLIALIICFIQSILYLVESFLKPSFNFSDYLLLQVHSTTELLMQIIGSMNLFIGGIMLFYLIAKKVPILINVAEEKQKKRKDEKQRQLMCNGPKSYILHLIFPPIFFTFLYISFLIGSFIHPVFAGFILFDIMNRLTLGRQILRSVKQTWFQLLSAILLLVVVNYLYALYVYIQFTPFYSPACESLNKCLLLLLDQSLKSGSGFLGTTPIDYTRSVFNLKFFSEMLYIIFAQKVIFEIFAGTIIDKFSELRQQNEEMLEDEGSNCYICGQERFTIDFELEGFEEHTQVTHNPLNYVYYLFYLRRSDPDDYGIIDRYVSDCQLRGKKDWVPNETSILKISVEKEKMKEEEENEEQKVKEYLSKKVKEVKQVRNKGNMIITELKKFKFKMAELTE